MKSIKFKKSGLWSVPNCPWLPQVKRDTEKEYVVGVDVCAETARRALLNGDAEEVKAEEVLDDTADQEQAEPEPEPEPEPEAEPEAEKLAKGKGGKKSGKKGG